MSYELRTSTISDYLFFSSYRQFVIVVKPDSSKSGPKISNKQKKGHQHYNTDLAA